jgi:uncharacterized protein (TIGR02147 family)
MAFSTPDPAHASSASHGAGTGAGQVPVTAAAKASAKNAAASALAAMSAPVLGEYTDYRQYLKDVYEHRRATEATGMRSYSYSTFSAAADIKSPNYLKLIIEGRRNLSDEMITRFAKALRLARQETEEFRALVLYGQASEPMERNQHLKSLADIRAQRAFAADVVNQRSWGKVPGWIGWVIYAMAEQRDVKFDPEVLQKLFRAKAGAEEIRTSLTKLLDSGELARDNETGEIYKVRDLVESPQDLPVPLIRKLQAELIYLGIESLFRDSPKDREFGAMTVAMTEEEFQQVRFELRQMRKRLQRDILVKRKTTKGERVYQLNVQLFPVTEKVDKKIEISAETNAQTSGQSGVQFHAQASAQTDAVMNTHASAQRNAETNAQNAATANAQNAATANGQTNGNTNLESNI